MIFKIIEKMKDEDFEFLRKSNDQEIILDLNNVVYLGSRDITRLLIMIKEGKIIKLKNTNLHIIETLAILKIDDLIKVI